MRRISAHKAKKNQRLREVEAARTGHARKQPLVIRNAPKRV